jgi:DHA2 family multidrug resistance protein
LQGFGMGFFFVPLTSICFNGLSQELRAEASGIFNFARNLGMSIGISLFSTLITRESQINWQRLGGHIHPYNENLKLWLQQHDWQINNPLALSELVKQLSQQAGMIAFIDLFWAVIACLLLMIPLVFFTRKI